MRRGGEMGGMIGKGEEGRQMQNKKSGGQKIYNTGQYTGNAGVWSENGCFSAITKYISK